MFGDRVMKQVITVQRGQTCGPSSSMTVSFSEKLGTKTHTGGDHVRTGRGGGGPPARREAAEETAPAGPVPADSQPPGPREHPFLSSKAPSLGSLVVAPLPK